MVPGNNMRKVRRLKPKFYDRDPRQVSRDLLGKLLVRNESNKVISGRIVEVEAYLSDDPAAHSAAGRTARNDVLFGPPGRGLCLLHLWQSLVLQRIVSSRRHRRRRPVPCNRASGWH